MKVAALDLGSNTFLCLIAEVEENLITRIYEDTLEVVRLGQDVGQTKKLHPEALFRADACLKNFKAVIDRHQPDKVLAMATSAARDATNKELLFAIGQKYKIPIEIIPGSEEARITFNGAMSGQADHARRLIVDIGGGSTEFIFGDSQIKHSQSLNVGCVRLTEKFVTSQPTSTFEISEIQKTIAENFHQLSKFQEKNTFEILAVAGTPTSLVTAEIGSFDAEKIEGSVLTQESLEKWKTFLQASTLEEKIKKGLPPGRADVILVGVLILIETLKYFNKDKLYVSTRGVRHGIALEVATRYLS